MLDSLSDWLIFIVVALILFGGSSKIPELARGLGRAMGEFRKAQIEVEREINTMVNKKEESRSAESTLTAEIANRVDKPVETTTINQPSVDMRIKELEAEINELKRMLDKR
jgi:twin arginine-targeting protein translocase, TatA/E family